MPASRVEVGEAARRHLPLADYADAFSIPSADRFLAESWAREAFEHVGVTDMIVMQGIWRVLLGLRLAALGSPGCVSGWRLLEEHEAVVVLASDSWLMHARLVFEVDRDVVTMTTLLRFRRRAGSLLWSAVGGVHRSAVPRMLVRSRSELRRTRSPGYGTGA